MPCIFGSFNHVGDSVAPICIPEGEAADGMPVIIFPPEGKQILTGQQYDIRYNIQGNRTREIEGKNYRVGQAYAATLQDLDE
jgi:hypothetical protein